MPINIGLDTSFIIGLLDEKDLWHAPARDLQTAFRIGDFRLIVFDCVLSEVISTLARRTREKRREAELKTLLERIQSQFPTKPVTWLYPDLPHLYDDVIQLVQRSAGELNFNDALIALSCPTRGIPYLASFDADFDQVNWLKRVARAGDLPT